MMDKYNLNHRQNKSNRCTVDVTPAFRTFFDVIPELVLTGTFLKGFREFHWTSAEVPEEDPKGVDVNRVIILSCEKDHKGGEKKPLKIVYSLNDFSSEDTEIDCLCLSNVIVFIGLRIKCLLYLFVVPQLQQWCQLLSCYGEFFWWLNSPWMSWTDSCCQMLCQRPHSPEHSAPQPFTGHDRASSVVVVVVFHPV